MSNLLSPEVEFSSLSLLEDPILHFPKILNIKQILNFIEQTSVFNYKKRLVSTSRTQKKARFPLIMRFTSIQYLKSSYLAKKIKKNII
jgi:hypothetical protein